MPPRTATMRRLATVRCGMHDSLDQPRSLRPVQSFVIHAHFYQPERLNPWTSELDPEPTAAPDRDWNARILRQCYRPNGAARIFDAAGRVERIVNNYERLSFNFGPTLRTWLERHAARRYAKSLAG